MKKKNLFFLTLAVLAIIAVSVWYFMPPLHYCEVVYSTDPHTKKLVVSCDATNCDKTCYLYFRKKGSEDDWRTPNESHTFDTSIWEYKCKCK